MGLGHSDLFFFDRPDFSIEDSRDLVDVNSRKPAKGDRKAILISLNSISHQAQNALLKVLEEPRPGTIIFILTNTASIFLPTVLSRVHVLKFDGVNEGDVVTKKVKSDDGGGVEDISDAGSRSKKKSKPIEIPPPEKFLKADKAERIAMVKELIDLKSDEKIGDSEIFTFAQTLEKLAHEKFAKAEAESVEKSRFRAAEIFTKVDEYLRDNSSSKKMLLEYIALMLP